MYEISAGFSEVVKCTFANLAEFLEDPEQILRSNYLKSRVLRQEVT